MWAWNDRLQTMVGVFPRDGDARDVRCIEGPARLTVHFLNPVSDGDVVRTELPVSDRARPSPATAIPSGRCGPNGCWAWRRTTSARPQT